MTITRKARSYTLFAAALAEARLWTRDRRLAAAAADLNLVFQDAS